MKLKGIQPGNVGDCFQETSSETSSHPRFSEMTCFALIAVIPKPGGSDSHDVMITCAGSQSDQLGMLAALVKHVMECSKLQHDLHAPDPLEKAENKDALMALVNTILDKVKKQ